MDEFSLIEKRVSDILRKVEFYQDLFGSKDSTKVLNATFPECFSLMQQSLFYEIVCRITALFDRAETFGNKNLTLAHLVIEGVDAYCAKMKVEHENIKSDFKRLGLKDIRNKLYAHNDLDVYLKRSNFTFSVSYDALKSLLQRIFKFVRELGLNSGKIPHGQTIHRRTLLPKNRDGVALVEKLKNL